MISNRGGPKHTKGSQRGAEAPLSISLPLPLPGEGGQRGMGLTPKQAKVEEKPAGEGSAPGLFP